MEGTQQKSSDHSRGSDFLGYLLPRLCCCLTAADFSLAGQRTGWWRQRLCGGIDWLLFRSAKYKPGETDPCARNSPSVPEQKLEQLVPLNKLYTPQPNPGTRNSLEEFQVKACLISSHQKCNPFLGLRREGRVAKSEDTWWRKKK